METINGMMLKQMLESGMNHLSNRAAEIDALNVFPVPDGDTGTNMSLTFSAGVKDALKVESSSVSEYSAGSSTADSACPPRLSRA